MSEQAQRIACAEILGYKITLLIGVCPDHHRITTPDGEKYSFVKLDDVVPNCLNDANAALRLKDSMEKQGFTFRIDYIGNEWSCRVWNEAAEESGVHYSSTLTDAIVTAALRATGRDSTGEGR